jgi:peptidyl-prolyl cis-trans isomerase A (cyclophilin A)
MKTNTVTPAQVKMRRVFLLLFLVPGLCCRAQVPDPAILATRAPEVYRAVFTTTKGDFTVEVYRDWSPQGADRLYQLLKSGFYNDNCLFRVQKTYVVQFGIGDQSEVNYFWDHHPIPDEPLKTSNLKGTISYARDTANSRTVQLFINMKDNYKLDTVNYNGVRGFPPVAKIVTGFETVEQFYGDYGFEPANHQDSAMMQGNRYWKQTFPGLDYVVKAWVVE